MRKYILLLLIVLVSISLSACSSQTDNELQQPTIESDPSDTIDSETNEQTVDEVFTESDLDEEEVEIGSLI